MNTTPNNPDLDDPWDSGELGRDIAFAQPAEADEKIEMDIDAAFGLKMISIRLEQSLIDDFKAIASLNGLGYQTLMHQALKRFAVSEKKLIVNEMQRRRDEDLASVIEKEVYLDFEEPRKVA